MEQVKTASFGGIECCVIAFCALEREEYKEMLKKKSILILLTCGSLMTGWLGCLNLNRLLQYGVYYAGLEFVTDQDGVFDLFESGATAANP